MRFYFNSLPHRENVVIGSPECGYIGFGWPIQHYCHRRCRRRHRHRHRHCCSRHLYGRNPFFGSQFPFESYDCSDNYFDGFQFPSFPYGCGNYPYSRYPLFRSPFPFESYGCDDNDTDGGDVPSFPYGCGNYPY